MLDSTVSIDKQPSRACAKSGNTRQIPDMPNTLDSGNASTCCFFTRKRRCARGFWNLPHTSGRSIRKCGENQSIAGQTPVLSSADLRFCCRKTGCARQVSIFPRTSKIHAKSECPEAKRDKYSSENSPLNAKTAYRRLPRTKPDIPSQGLITARALRKGPAPVKPLPEKRGRQELREHASVELHASRKTPAISPFLN